MWINYSQIDLATGSEENHQYVLKCAKTAKKVTFSTKNKVKEKDSEYKNSSLVGQIDCKKTKEKSTLHVKCSVNSFRKNTPISARNVLKHSSRSNWPQKQEKED